MTSGLERACVAAVALGAASCAGAPPKAAEPKPAPVVAVAAEPPQKVDLSAVPEPEHLVGLVRFQNPAKSIRTATGWVGLPLNSRALFQGLHVPQFADIAQDEAPVDLAFLLDAQAASEPERALVGAIAFGVKSLEAARAALGASEPAAQVAPGVYRLAPIDGPEDSSKKIRCTLAASVGTAPARIVCGTDQKDVDALLPFMTRTLPSQNYGDHDLHAEVRVPVVQAIYGAILHQVLRGGALLLPERIDIREPTFDRAISRTAVGLAEEVSAVVKDAGTVALDLDLGSHAVDLRVSAQLRGRESWTSGMLASRASTQGSAPGSFWTLPKTATSAGFVSPSDPSKINDIMLIAGELLSGFLHHEGISEKDRGQIVQLLRNDRRTGAGLIVASGQVAESLGTAKAKQDNPRKPEDDTPAHRAWTLVGIQESKIALQNIKDLVASLNQPSIKKLINDRLLAHHHLASLDVRSVTPPPGLAKGTIDILIGVSVPSAPEATKPHGPVDKQAKLDRKEASQKRAIHLIALADNGTTWIALGAEPANLASILLSASRGNAAGETLKGEPELTKLSSDKLVLGGFFTLKQLEQPSPAESLLWPHRHAWQTFRLESAPNRGMTPMTYELGISTDGPLTLNGSLHVPSGAIDDLAMMLTSLVLRR